MVPEYLGGREDYLGNRGIFTPRASRVFPPSRGAMGLGPCAEVGSEAAMGLWALAHGSHGTQKGLVPLRQQVSIPGARAHGTPPLGGGNTAARVNL